MFYAVNFRSDNKSRSARESAAILPRTKGSVEQIDISGAIVPSYSITICRKYDEVWDGEEATYNYSVAILHQHGSLDFPAVGLFLGIRNLVCQVWTGEGPSTPFRRFAI